MNRVDVSADRKTAVIRGPNGERCELRSARPDGFTDTQVQDMRDYRFTVRAGQKHWARTTGPLFMYAGTGPPTWWWPRLKLHRWGVFTGWLRLALGVRLR